MNIWAVLVIITAPAILYGTALHIYGHIQRRRAARHRTHARDLIARVHAESIAELDATKPRYDEPRGLPAGWHWPNRDHDPPPAEEPLAIGPRPYLIHANHQQWH